MFGRIADSNRLKGDLSWFGHASYHIGALHAELMLKIAREELFERGLQNERYTRNGGEANRKGDLQTRLIRFSELRSQSIPVMECYRRIAEEEGSAFTTVGDAIRKAKKDSVARRH